MSVPTKCLQPKPTRSTVRFAGVAINLALVAEQTKLDHGYLSKVFAGKRTRLSLLCAEKIADALGMSLTDFWEALKAKQTALQRRRHT